MTAVYTHAVADKSADSLYDRLGGRIYPVAAPDNVRFRYLVFQQMGAPRENGYGFAITDMAVRFFVYTEDRYDYTKTAQILDEIEDRFAGANLTVAGGTAIIMRPETRIGPEKIEGFMQGAYDFTFMAGEAT